MNQQDWNIALAGIMAIKGQGNKSLFTPEELDNAMRSVMHEMLKAINGIAPHSHDGHDHVH
mgnify:FL=1